MRAYLLSILAAVLLSPSGAPAGAQVDSPTPTATPSPVATLTLFPTRTPTDTRTPTMPRQPMISFDRGSGGGCAAGAGEAGTAWLLVAAPVAWLWARRRRR